MKFCAAPATRRRELMRKVRSGVNEATFADAYGSDCIAPIPVVRSPEVEPPRARPPTAIRSCLLDHLIGAGEQ
jgi:hypothetical protein